MLIFFIIIHGHELFGLGDKGNNLLKINLGWNQFKLNFILTYNINYIPKQFIYLITSDNSKRVFSSNSALDGSVVSQLTTEKKITYICQHIFFWIQHVNNKVIKAIDYSDFSGKQRLKKTRQTNRGCTEESCTLC